jgi:hypothetical protein
LANPKKEPTENSAKSRVPVRQFRETGRECSGVIFFKTVKKLEPFSSRGLVAKTEKKGLYC